MKLPLSWLKEFVTVEADEATLSHRLSVAGLEVEAIEHLRPPFEGVVVARVLDVRRHPNADRLNLCEVEAGAHGHFRVVCGAPNVRPGMIAPLALVGARLGGAAKGGGLEGVAPLQAAVIRGERSEGMLCSGRELGLSDDHAGIVDLEAQATVGVTLAEYLNLEDTVFDVAITPNRGDCLSILGLAREVSALFGAPLRQPRVRIPRTVAGESPAVEILAAGQCRRYAAIRLDGITIGPSPALIRRRLEMAGMRPINNVVDITNYVMLELGQPLHAFDFHKLAENRIIVRQAGADREFVTLDDVRRELEPADLVIADARGPVAIAGIMGGQSSEVSAGTTSILIESAYFEPSTIIRTARRLGLRSEASYRFERGIDRAGQATAAWRAAELAGRFAGGKLAGPIRDVEPLAAENREIELDLGRMAALLGVEVARGEVGRRLAALGAKVKSGGKGRIIVQAPPFRPDLREAADLAEEVARLSGLEEIPERLPPRPIGVPAAGHARQLAAAARDTMAGCGLTEIRTIAFTAPEDNRRFPGLGGHPPVVVANPLSAELSELRRSLLPGLINALRFNLNRQASAFHAFELAKAFAQEQSGPRETLLLAGVSYGDWLRPGVGQSPVAAGFFTVKGIVETLLQTVRREGEALFAPIAPGAAPYLHPGKSAQVTLQGQALGVLGELHPETALSLDLGLPCAVFELDFSLLAALGTAIQPIVAPPRFPAIRRDLALVMDRATPAGQVIETLRQLNVQWLESIEVFDVYTGEGIAEGRKSVALALRYRAKDRTLTDDEVNRTHEYLIRQATAALDAQLR